MSYDALRKQYAKEPFHFIEIEVDGTTWRFCTKGRVPAGLDAAPTLRSISMAAATIDLTGGFGLRASASVSLDEHMDYTSYGTPDSPVQFWKAWRAKNPYYKYKRISVYSGYIPNNVYDPDNFIQRDYVIDSFTQTSDGASISLRDPLILASDDSAQLPLENSGYLSLAIGETATSITLSPTGIGDDEYDEADSADSSTWYYIRINDEVMLVTERLAGSDTLTIGARAQFNTEASEHDADDSVQQCLYFDSETISNIAYYLLNTGASIPSTYINKSQWDSISDTYFPNSYTAIITEPTGVKTLIEELCESAPHYYYYDERYNQIQFVPFKAPSSGGTPITYEGNLLKGQTAVGDDQDARISTVIIYFGIYNPVKDLDETSNYRQVYIREDSDSVTNYGSRAYKTIYSRWISNDSKTAAVLAASRWGRRFAEAPRNITYKLDAKDADKWTGDNQQIITDLIYDPDTLEPATLTYQVISAKENTSSHIFEYSASEHVYGEAVPGDDDVEDENTRIVYIVGENDQLKDDAGNVRTLRDWYDEEYDIQANYDVRIIVDVSAVTGSSDTSAYAIRTGEWPELTTPPMLIVYGYVVGKGGDGGGTNNGLNGFDGGPAILLENDIRLNNLNVIAGGAGGGGAAQLVTTTGELYVMPGGGGAGYTVGSGASGSADGGAVTSDDGTLTTGGDGAEEDSGIETARGGAGGDLGQDGQDGVTVVDTGTGTEYSGGSAGKAIELNGFAITYINAGTILGDVS